MAEMKNLEFNSLETARVNIISHKIWRGIQFKVDMTQRDLVQEARFRILFDRNLSSLNLISVLKIVLPWQMWPVS